MRKNVNRGQTFVRAYYYLFCIETMGEEPKVANEMASSLFTSYSDPSSDEQIVHRAKNFADENFSGKQLPVISLAIDKGYEN